MALCAPDALPSSAGVVGFAPVEEVLEAQRREPPREDEDDVDEAEDVVEDDEDERDAAGVTASTGSSVDSTSAGGVWGAGAARSPPVRAYGGRSRRAEKGWDWRGEEMREKGKERFNVD
jgi:hypothetical protein